MYVDKVHDEDQRLVRADHPSGSTRAVTRVSWDGEPSPAAHPHAFHSPVPALDDLSAAEPELEGVTSVPGCVELSARRPGHPDVVHFDGVTRVGGATVADGEVLDHQVAGGGIVRDGHVGFGHVPRAQGPAQSVTGLM